MAKIYKIKATEGSNNRTNDLPFSHDIGHITLKTWIEFPRNKKHRVDIKTYRKRDSSRK